MAAQTATRPTGSANWALDLHVVLFSITHEAPIAPVVPAQRVVSIMTDISWLLLYSLLIPIASLLGGHLPFRGRVTHSRLQFYLSLSAGVMLGASFFHVMPEAMDYAGAMFGWWMSLGVVGLFCVERFIAPHSHELDGGGHAHRSKQEH